jgi:cytochrome b subunit of formate dehydrogenase
MSDLYRNISFIAFAVTIAGIALNCIVSPCRECWRHPLRKLVHLFTLLFIEQKLSFTGVLRKLVFLLALLCFIILAVTGFYPTLVLGEHISGYLLMIHATFSPVFAVCLAVLAVMWANKCGFTHSDWPWFSNFVERITLVKSANYPQDKTNRLGLKITFWIIMFLALPLILSIILSMFPYFGTYWQELLLAVHRWTALSFTIAVIINIYLMIRIQMN